MKFELPNYGHKLLIFFNFANINILLEILDKKYFI